MNNSLRILLISTASIAFLHALAPDHWMPFAAIARALNWSKLKLLWITFISGLGHVGISIALGIIGILLGFSLSGLQSFEGHRGEIALWLLIGFGIAYALWGLKQRGRHKQARMEEERLRKKTVAMWTFFAVFVLGPCEPLIPLMFLGYQYGWPGVIIVSTIFSIITIIMMFAQSLLAFLGVQFVRHNLIERYVHSLAGLVIVLTGIFLFFC